MGLDAESPVHSVWKNDLYRMQLNAPVALPVICETQPINTPSYLGRDYHGDITHIQANNLLSTLPNGAYLVRTSRISNGQFHTLSLKFNDNIHHYKLYYDPNSGLYVREKKYDCVRSLVADGLVTLYLELKAPLTLQRLPKANYLESPYMTLNKRKLRVLNRQYSRKENYPDKIIRPQELKSIFAEKQEKSHSFKVTTFKGFNWCEYCGNYLWGFSSQGVRCDDCGIIAHNKCSQQFPKDCVPDLKYIRGVFGIELTTLLTAHNAKLPFVVTKCVCEVEKRGLLIEGIYRLSGFQEEIEAIKMALDKDGDKADLSDTKYMNINVITGALKLYLRVLPIPLISFMVHPLLIKALSNRNLDEILLKINEALKTLQKPYYDTLKYMIQHLKRVSEFSNVNKMNPHNLATVFAPTLINRTEAVSMDDPIPDITSDIRLIETLIIYYENIFTH